MAVEYVRFLRGTPEAFEKLSLKDHNTLYFVAEKKATTGKLYLGDKLIIGSLEGVSLDEISDIPKEQLTNNDLLVYDAAEQKWINKSFSQLLAPIISIMEGATETSNGKAGLVPMPKIEDKKKFLRGDGTWGEYEFSEEDYEAISTHVDTSMYWDNF